MKDLTCSKRIFKFQVSSKLIGSKYKDNLQFEYMHYYCRTSHLYERGYNNDPICPFYKEINIWTSHHCYKCR